MLRLATLVLSLLPAFAHAQGLILVDPSDGKYLGNLNASRYDPNSVSNPYGQYGSRYSPDSINSSMPRKRPISQRLLTGQPVAMTSPSRRVTMPPPSSHPHPRSGRALIPIQILTMPLARRDAPISNVRKLEANSGLAIVAKPATR